MSDQKYEAIKNILSDIDITLEREDFKKDPLTFNLLLMTGNHLKKKEVARFLEKQSVPDDYLLENILQSRSFFTKEEKDQMLKEHPDNPTLIPSGPIQLETVLFQNEMGISIQAGSGPRSLPRRVIVSKEDIANFTHFEVMAFDKEIIKPYFDAWQAFVVDSKIGLYNFVPKKLIELTLAKADENYGIVRNV